MRLVGDSRSATKNANAMPSAKATPKNAHFTSSLSERSSEVAPGIEAMTAAGEDAFTDYQVPLAILALQQGLGRLIRHRSDRGVLAILDPRLQTMGYGRRFLASLPPAPVTHDLDAVGRFFRVD